MHLRSIWIFPDGIKSSRSSFSRIVVVPTKRQRFRRRPEPTVAAQPQDHLPDRIGLLHQLVDDFAWHKLVDLHRTLLRFYFAERVLVDDELECELDPFMDRGRGHP